ncbi:hypothetical protein [Aquibacillus kalidii]|uniref:hypothetical protein n=1 Tax=Aquibacillus kalidii TaxID=2762597 RepID=UPI00164775BD|nr:hypothetical protein [Aquibacillus kalidii]
MLVSAEEAERRRERQRYLRKAAELEEYLSRLDQAIQDFHHADHTFKRGCAANSGNWLGNTRREFNRCISEVAQSKRKVEQTYSELRQETRNKLQYYRQKVSYYS